MIENSILTDFLVKLNDFDNNLCIPEPKFCGEAVLVVLKK